MLCWFIFQGTMALELLEQVPDLDAILVSASGGGMISGISIVAKSIKKDIKGYEVHQIHLKSWCMTGVSFPKDIRVY